jgi:hypothetical protein
MSDRIHLPPDVQRWPIGLGRQYRPKNPRLFRSPERNRELRRLRRRKQRARRRADKLRREYPGESLTPIWADLRAMDRFYASSPAEMTIDHIIPFHGLTAEGYPVVGLHTLANLQYLPALDNATKSSFMTRAEQALCESAPLPELAEPTQLTLDLGDLTDARRR